MQKETLRYVIGIDGGGSKTAFVLCSERGDVISRCVRGPSNAANVGLEAACAVMADGIAECLPAGTAADAVFAGIAGKHLGEVAGFLRGLCPGAAVETASDAVNILAAGDCPTAIICGTGSIVIAEREGGHLILGGWGHLMGDPGSAYNIGREGIRAALAEEQGLAPACAVTPLLRGMLGLPDGTPVADALRQIRERGVSFIASLARAVLDAAEKGDAAAEAILDRELRDAMHELNTARRLCGTGPRVAAAGGVLKHNRELLLPLMRKYALPDTEFIFPALPPVFGACRRALALLGIPADDAFAAAFGRTYPG